MNKEELDKILSGVTESLGQDTIAPVADQFAEISTGLTVVFNEKAELEKSLAQQKVEQEKLLATNAKMYNQIMETNAINSTRSNNQQGNESKEKDPEDIPTLSQLMKNAEGE